ncbi:MAG: preprotein translocase subunit YajC [Alphaproteobacteria bacterium]
MLISQAYAAAADTAELDLAGAPTPGEALFMNLGLVVLLVVLFYVLLIMPQQRRFKEHSSMLSELKKGDRIVTSGGLVGKIEKIVDDSEVIIDLGNSVKVTALRSMIQGKTQLKPKAAANDSKTDKKADKKTDSKAKKDAKKTEKK